MPMRRIPHLLTGALAACLAATPAAAQTDYYARAGAQFMTPILRDDIVDPIEVRAGVAPQLVLGASVPLSPTARVGLELGAAFASFEADEEGLTRDAGSATLLSALLNLSGRLVGPVGWRAGLGTLTYLPGEDDGIFRRGGPTLLLAGGGADYRRPAFSGWDLMISARYDYHRFTTDELESRGFANTQSVHRVALTAGLARGLR